MSYAGAPDAVHSNRDMIAPLTHVGPGPVYRDEAGQLWLFANPYAPLRLWHGPGTPKTRRGDHHLREKIKRQMRRRYLADLHEKQRKTRERNLVLRQREGAPA